ncbi:MAG: EF-hand domain-containing protein [Verrucomicrobiota bacterium]
MKTIPVSFLVAGMLLPAVCLAEPPAPPQSPSPSGEKSPGGRPNPFAEAWKHADSDHDGFISQAEFNAMPRIQNLPEEKRVNIFKRLDKDGDGKLSRQELMKLGRPHEGPPMKRLWELDADKSGGISLEEFKVGEIFKKLPPEKQVEVFHRLDTDKDGLITPKDRPEPFKRRPGKPGKGPEGRKPGDDGDPGRTEKMIQKLDTNSDGALSFEEFRAGQGVKDLTEDEQEDRFESLDRNGDHRISKDECPPPPPLPEMEPK